MFTEAIGERAGRPAERPRRHSGRLVAVVGSGANETTRTLAAVWRRIGMPAVFLGAGEARRVLRPGDVAVGRLDVRASLDGVEPGLLDLLLLERSGVEVLNGATALLRVHDKLRTYRALSALGVPTPFTHLVRDADEPLAVTPPLVVKPRFGSWGRDVRYCSTAHEARVALLSFSRRRWFRRHGALVQPALSHVRPELRVVVSGRRVIGAAERRPRPGEWRANVSLGARLEPVRAPAAVRTIALAAVDAVGIDLAGVDVACVAPDRYVVIELNAAVDFDGRYAVAGRDIYRQAALGLGVLTENARTRAARAERERRTR